MKLKNNPTAVAPASNKPPAERLQISYVAVADLVPDPNNARKHSRAQIRAIAKSIETFGFAAPMLIDRFCRIRAGGGRYEAAKLLGLKEVPAIFLDHLTETQATAYALADNKLSDRSGWNEVKLAVQLKELSELALDFDIEATGFEMPEIDLRIQSLDSPDAADRADEFEPATGPAVSRLGDIWQAGPHRLICANALDASAYVTLMEDEKAKAVFSDAPFNVPIDGHVSGLGRVTHREFAMASGEMTPEQFTEFLAETIKRICEYTTPGALLYLCMDWRHMAEMVAAGRSNECELLNLIVWAKTNGGMGSFYRSAHELIFLFRNGKHSHLNNVQLGRFGRNRTNLWTRPGFNGFARRNAKDPSAIHPTVKPVGLVSDAILDSTNRNDIVLDPFLGSGTSVLAATRTGRRCFGIEIDPIYVDTAIDRWQRMTGLEATTPEGKTFAQVKAERGAAQ